MDQIINRIYNLLYSPIITPFNLLENAKLNNYYYVNYYKGESGLITEMKCDIEENTAIFYYHFDQEDKLFKIIMEDEVGKKVMFDRNNELEREKQKYLKSKKEVLTGNV